MNDHELPSVLTLEQAATYLQIPLVDLQAELEKGHIPGRQIAGQWRIKKEVLLRLLEEPSPQADTVKSAPVDGATVVATTTLVPIDDVEHPAVTEPVVTKATKTPEPPPDPPKPQPESLPTSPRSSTLPTPSPGCEHARVFSYNLEQGYGSGRLMDNRYVFLDSRNLVDSNYRPFPGDIVELEPTQTKKRGLEGRRIQLVLRSGALNVTAPITSGVTNAIERKITPTKTSDTPTPLPSLSRPKQSRKSVPTPQGPPRAQELYARAAVARQERRYSDARRLFREAIQAGGEVSVYIQYSKMEDELRQRDEARRIARQAMQAFPTDPMVYDMYGQMERRARNYKEAETIFRQGLTIAPTHRNLLWGLGQTLSQMSDESSLREAGEIFDQLDRRGMLNKTDNVYRRFQALRRNARANRAYTFFKASNLRVGIAGRRDLPAHITDLLAETTDPELAERFGLTGGFLVRCFQRNATHADLVNLSAFLEGIGNQHILGVQEGWEAVLNPTLAFIVVPNVDAVHDHVMSLNSVRSAAIVPLDDMLLEGSDAVQTLRDKLSYYFARRDLYTTGPPVSGRRHFGRERLLLQLIDELHHGHFIGIYGLRRMGKTSLTWHLRDEKLKGDLIVVVTLLEYQASAEGHCGPIYWAIERELYSSLGERSLPEAAELMRLGRVPQYSQLSVDWKTIQLYFREDLRALLDEIKKGALAGIGHLIIVLDELERILPLGGQKGMEGYLDMFALFRGLSQNERYLGLFSSIVVAANASISERGYWQGQENPVFALYRAYFLKPLTDKECAEMIVVLGRGMSVYWESDALDEVHKETAGHPFLARTFCSFVAEQNSARPLTVTKEMVRAAIPDFLHYHGDKLGQITELIQQIFPDEEKLLFQMARDELPSEFSDDALRHLQDYGLIIRRDGTYAITMNLLKRWLRRRAGIKE